MTHDTGNGEIDRSSGNLIRNKALYGVDLWPFNEEWCGCPEEKVARTRFGMRCLSCWAEFTVRELC